ncbi:carbohydrate kinase family protein [Roseobacter sp. GAI101]|uniref:carbohydrate kinase family protein n=1 Tax=Roseobacter sp. (strain GAI101) TaxID=391589 RepID=UPI0018DB7A9C|nr:PfkB family carbohydrate kinase [Roseobacter sp. GAI101]
MRLVFDPAPIVAALAQDVVQAALARAEWVSANLHEATILTGCSDPTAAAKALAANRAGGAIVRNGAAGCVLCTAETCVEIPPFNVQAIDTNGAGDAHIGSFIAHLSQTGDPSSAASFANVAAALSTTVKGPASAPTAEQIAAARQRSNL